jgi:hypothetical protein
MDYCWELFQALALQQHQMIITRAKKRFDADTQLAAGWRQAGDVAVLP